MNEVWRPVPNYEGFYEVSDMGRVRSLPRMVKARYSPWLDKGRILKPGEIESGHQSVDLRKNGKGRRLLVHRLVLQAFIGPFPPGTECAHNNGNARDNRLSNLRFATRKENAADKKIHGTNSNGEKNGRHKLTDELVREIRADRSPIRQCGAKYGVNHTLIHRIRARKAWTHVI